MSTLAWPPAMVVIFLGATTPAASWPVAGVVGLGAVTGLAAGAVLGVVSGAFLPSLNRAASGPTDDLGWGIGVVVNAWDVIGLDQVPEERNRPRWTGCARGAQTGELRGQTGPSDR